MVLQWVLYQLQLMQIHLCHFEKQWLSEYAPDNLSEVFKRCVDNIFVMFFCQSHLLNTKQKH